MNKYTQMRFITSKENDITKIRFVSPPSHFFVIFVQFFFLFQND